MENNQLPKSEFVREQIKTKSKNKRKLVGKFVVSALCGVVFALAAALTLFLLQPFLKEFAGDTEIVSETGSGSELTEEPTESQMPTEEPTESGDPENPPTVIAVPNELTLEDYQKLHSELYAVGTRANKSIVTITSVVSDTDWFNNSYEREGQGSGTIIGETKDAYLILTERKVITDAAKTTVTFIDETTAPAELMKYDGNTGLAILSVRKKDIGRIPQGTIGVIPMGDSARVRRGMLVIALGSPLGTNYSILTGNITAVNNEISTLDSNYSVFTTDIAASKNGSGILINTKGELVGIVMQDYSASSANTLTAVAVSELAPVIEHLINGQDIPYLGLRVSTVTGKIAGDYGLPLGVYVKQVKMDSPAMLAGIQNGDVIVEMDKKPVMEDKSYYDTLLHCVPGQTCEVVIMRQGSSGYGRIVCEVEPGVLR